MKVINGLCVSRGNAKGIAIQVDSERITNLPKHCILIMKQLDRSLLVNLNANVVGVVAEIGNIGSHGAGILRQLGIPCVLRIENATKLIANGEQIEICGEKNCIICSKSNLLYNNCEKPFGHLYKSISKPGFGINDIGVENSWTCGRPERAYQVLRFDILSEPFSKGANFLYGLPKSQVRQNDYGAIIQYGGPCIEDICSYVLANPQWLVEKAKQRTIEFNAIKKTLLQLNKLVDSNNALTVFIKGVKLYQEMFKYTHMSQSISDEILDIYIDFCSYINHKMEVSDILNLHSIYVENCLKEGIDPGVSQRWKTQKIQPHIWDGYITMEALQLNELLVSNINSGAFPNPEQLLKDYEAFRIIVPLVYELSEEFFYISSSVNSFINWAIIELCDSINKKYKMDINVNDAYNMSYNEFVKLATKSIK
mgnify:CR=1 FL=1